MVADARTGRFSEIPAYWTYIPRRDQPERYDEQESFYYDKVPGVAFMCGGNGCIAPDEKLFDVDKNEWIDAQKCTKPFRTLGCAPDGSVRIQYSAGAYLKGRAKLYRVRFSDGSELFCTDEHRLLTPAGYQPVSQLAAGSHVLSAGKSAFDCSHQDTVDTLAALYLGQLLRYQQWPTTVLHALQTVHETGHPTSAFAHPESLAVFGVLCEYATSLHAGDQPRHAHAVTRTPQDCQVDCRTCHDSCDARPPQVVVACQASAPQLADALEHIRLLLHLDVLEPESTHSHLCRLLCLLCTTHCGSPAHLLDASDILRVSKLYSPLFLLEHTLSQGLAPNTLSNLSQTADGQSPQLSSQTDTTASWPQSATEIPSASQSPLHVLCVVEISPHDEGLFYDLTCLPDNNYLTRGGIISHNSGTTTTAIAKAIKFILETPAPRRDTPFWFIAETYEQVCNLYDEKISGLGHLPEHLIERNRIFWKNRNNNWPLRVPLKSHQGRRGKNWVLEFKSWKQGRGQMQARSIGGFLFMEQFPWKVFEEVVRGCREYNFPGAKLVEYTPVDPDLSIEIEEMLEHGYEPEDPKQKQKGARYLPKDWKVYHANTLCAMEEGHVDKAWFEEFFGMIPEDMLDVRMKGLFASFEGTIYKEFEAKTHCVGDEAWKYLQDAHWIRGIDWGGGPENAFCCLLLAITPDGTAYVMDEYYSFDQNCTTIDHLVNIQDQMPWPLDNPNYGMTYADPADPDNFRIASKLSQYAKSHRGVDIQNMPMARAKNAVFEGIEHIRMMLKPSRLKAVLNRDTNMLEEKKFPRLFIHRGNCPNLIRELKTYRWQKSADPTGKGIINPRAAKRAPAKFNDHACFTPDTLVQAGFKTIKPISEVKVGETVVGRDKRSRVLAGWTVTRRNVEILELTFKHTGEKIKCTPDHRLWFWGQWVRADLLKDDHDIFSSWTSYVVPEVGCIATQNGNFKLACGIVAKNCDALRYALATHYQAMGMTIESARLSKPRAGAPESVRDSGKRYSAVTEMHRGG